MNISLNNIIMGLIGYISVLGIILLTSCDSHRDFPDTSIHVGYVLCNSGKVMSYDDAKSHGETPCAVIFSVNDGFEKEGVAYAVALYNTPALEFADTLGISQGTSASMTLYDGNTNTYKMQSKTECGSPLAQYVIDICYEHQSAYIPSVAQMNLLYAAKRYVNPVIEKCGGTPLSDEDSKTWLWTSTEVEGQSNLKSWLYAIGSGQPQETPKIQAHRARPIITVYNE